MQPAPPRFAAAAALARVVVLLGAATAMSCRGERERAAAAADADADAARARDTSPRAAASAPPAAAGDARLALVARIAAPPRRAGPATLVAGTRRIAVWDGAAGWYEPDARGLAAQPLVGRAIAAARDAVGPLAEPHLGSLPVLSGGDEHREQHLRLAPAAQPIAIPGMLVAVATAPAAAAELWWTEHELRSALTPVVAGRALPALPALAARGPALAARSPVSSKACAVPRVRALAGSPAVILALVTECHPDAPVRIAEHRWPAGPSAPPARQVIELGSLAALAASVPRPAGEADASGGARAGDASGALQLDHLVATPGGDPVLVGRRSGVVVVLRVAASGRVAASAPGPRGVSALTHAAVASDGAVWTRSLVTGAGGRDAITIARDGAPVRIALPSGAPLAAEALAFDEHLGIVVLARAGAEAWLLAERPPPAVPPA